MDSIVNKLTEIESAASAIVQHAEVQKEEMEKEYDEKRRIFDSELEAKTQAQIKAIRDELEATTSQILDTQSSESTSTIDALQREYEENHTEYAKEILRRITEV